MTGCCTDLTFVPLQARRADLPPGMKIVVMTDRAHELPDLFCFEELLSGQAEHYDWPSSTRTPRARCATPRAPPGIPRARCIPIARWCCTTCSRATPTCPVSRARQVPAGGSVVPCQRLGPVLAPMSGAGMVMPGQGLDDPSLFKLMDDEDVSSAWGADGLAGSARRDGATGT